MTKFIPGHTYIARSPISDEECPSDRMLRVPCEVCQREGRIIRRGVKVWEEVDCGPCRECDGTAFVTVETHPRTLEDMEHD
jgi:hypothetical protein